MNDIHHDLSGRDGEVLVIRAPRDLSHETADDLRNTASRHLPNRDRAGLVIDMTEVRLISSIGIAALLQVQELCRERSSRMVLAALPDAQTRFLKMLKLDRKFCIVGTVSDAVALLADNG
ncbi:MAG: STAS domain-containing protein [Phycisphaerales bacterium]|nr:STAS domain-containing protein [Phycisphaerales bacterium]